MEALVPYRDTRDGDINGRTKALRSARLYSDTPDLLPDGLQEDVHKENVQAWVEMWFDMEAYCDGSVSDDEPLQVSERSSLKNRPSKTSIPCKRNEDGMNHSTATYKLSQSLAGIQSYVADAKPLLEIGLDDSARVNLSIDTICISPNMIHQDSNMSLTSNQELSYTSSTEDPIEDRRARSRIASQKFRQRTRERQNILRQRLNSMLSEQKKLQDTIDNLETENQMMRTLLATAIKMDTPESP